MKKILDSELFVFTGQVFLISIVGTVLVAVTLMVANRLDTNFSKYKTIEKYVAKKTSYIKRLEKDIAEYRENVTDLNQLLLSAKTEELKNSIKEDIEDYKRLIKYREDLIKKERIQVTKEAK